MPVKRLGAVTGDQRFGALGLPDFAGARGAVVGPRGYLTRLARLANVELPPLDDVSAAPPLPVHLSEDQWRVLCPDCTDVQLAWTSVRLYMCGRCWNASAGGSWRRIEWPAEREAVDRAVAGIARPEERCWFPGWAPGRAALEAGNGRRITMAEYRAALEPRATEERP